MKKQTVTFMVLMTIGTALHSQVADNPKSKPSVKSEINSTEQLSFHSIEEKNAAVERVKNQIDLRISLGKTQEELAPRYAELKRIMNALITPKINKNEK